MAFLPQYIGGASPWSLYDYRQLFLTSDPAADGAALVQFPQVPQDELWLVERMTVRSTSTSKTEGVLYLDSIDPTRQLEGTRSGNFDVADEASPVQVPGASSLLFQWTGASDGAVCSLRAQVVILRRTS